MYWNIRILSYVTKLQHHSKWRTCSRLSKYLCVWCSGVIILVTVIISLRLYLPEVLIIFPVIVMFSNGSILLHERRTMSYSYSCVLFSTSINIYHSNVIIKSSFPQIWQYSSQRAHTWCLSAHTWCLSHCRTLDYGLYDIPRVTGIHLEHVIYDISICFFHICSERG